MTFLSSCFGTAAWGYRVSSNGEVFGAVNEATVRGAAINANQFWLRLFINSVAVNGATNGTKGITSWECGPTNSTNSPIQLKLNDVGVNCEVICGDLLGSDSSCVLSI